MRKILFLSFVLLGFNVHARTEGRFLGVNYMINITSQNFDGSFSDTPAYLYKQMNVPEQQSMMGPGKALEVSNKELSFICSKKAENNYHCSILVFNSSQGNFSFHSAQIKYTGEKAKAVVAQFFPNEDGSDINLTDDTGQFHLVVKPDLFELTFESHARYSCAL